MFSQNNHLLADSKTRELGIKRPGVPFLRIQVDTFENQNMDAFHVSGETPCPLFTAFFTFWLGCIALKQMITHELRDKECKENDLQVK